MALADELERIAVLAGDLVGPGDVVSAILATEPSPGRRAYVCAFDDADHRRSWLAVDDAGQPIRSRVTLREAVSIAALCEIAGDAAGGGDLEGLVVRLVELREREAPPGIEAAEEAARTLRQVVGGPPQLATPERLDAIGAAARRLEQELDPTAASPFAATLRSSQGVVDELQREVEAGYRVPLD